MEGVIFIVGITKAGDRAKPAGQTTCHKAACVFKSALKMAKADVQSEAPDGDKEPVVFILHSRTTCGSGVPEGLTPAQA